VNSLEEIFPINRVREAALAERYLAEGIIEISQFAPVRIERSVWSSGPLEDRSWQWALHSFLPLDCLIATGRAEAVAALVREWEANCEQATGEFPWHDHATALRLDRLSRMALQLERCKFAALAARHASRLMQSDFYSHHTNHGFAQAMSLVLASIAFSEHPDSSFWRQTGAERLKDEIAFAFTDEGVHVENSPGYHLGMMPLLDRAKTLLAAANVPFETTQTSLYEGALAFLAWMARPDRNLVYLGDTSRYRVSASEKLQHLKNYPMLRYAATGGVEGSPPDETSMTFEKSGYAAYRSHWKPWSGHTHIVMKCGNLSSYHRHDDDLNIVVHAFGEDWLIDSGLYNHNQKDPIRIYMRSAQAHNIPWFPGRPVRRTPLSNRMARLKRLVSEDFELAVEGETSMYAGLRVTRQLLISGPDRFQIRDRIQTTKEEAVGIPRYWIFHTPLDKKVSVSPSAARIRGRKMELMLRLSGSQRLPCSVHRGLGDVFSSLFSEKLGESLESQIIVFGPSTQEKADFHFKFQERDQKY